MASILDFGHIFKIPILAMKIIGSHPDVKRDLKWTLKFLVMHGVFTLFFCLLLYSIVMHDIKTKNIVQACTNGVLALLYLFMSFQYIVMIRYKGNLKRMFRTMKRDFAEAERSPERRFLVLKYAYRGRLVIKLWILLIVMSIALFFLKSVFTMIYYAIQHEIRLVPVFQLTYPKPLEEMRNDIPFIIAYLTMLWCLFYIASITLGIVPMGPIFMLHACAQLQITKMKINNFYPKNKYRHVDTIKNMKDVAKQLQDIYGFVENIQNTYQYIYECYMKGAAVLTPIILYQILQSFCDGNISLEFVAMAFCCVFSTSVPCYYSDLLLEISERVREAIYMSGWEKHSERRERSLILMLLLRMERPMAVRTVFLTMSLEALTAVFQQAYAIFNFLNVTTS